MPLYEDDFKSVLKGFAQHQKDLQPTQKELDDEAKRKRQEQLMKTTAATATADANKPGLIGRVASGVGNFVKDAAISVKNDAETASKGVYHAVAGDIAAHDNANISADKLKKSQEFSQKLQGMVGDAWGNPNDPKWSDPAVKKAIEDHNAEMAKFDQTNSNRVASNQAETQRGQNVDAKKTAMAAASTFLNVATLGEGAAVKAGAEQAGKQLIEQGAKQAGKGLIRTTARGAAEGAVFGAASGAANAGATDGNVAEGALKGAEMGAAFGGASTAAGKLFKDAKAARAAGADTTQIATHETPPSELASAVQAGDFTEEEARKILEHAQAGRKAEFDNLMAQRKFENSTAPESGAVALLPERTGGDPVRPVSQIDAELQDLQTNGIVNATPAESKAKFDALHKERQTALANEAEKGFVMRQQDQQAFSSNGLPNTPEEAKAALDNFDANPPATAVKPDAPVSSATEIFSHPNMPPEIKGAAQTILDDKGAAENVLSTLMTPQKKQAAHAQMDEAYKTREAQIADMPAPRQDAEMQKLDEQYTRDLQDLEDQAAADAPEVQKHQAIIDHLDSKEQYLVDHTNHLMQQAPDHFVSPDPAELAAQRTPLQENLAAAERHNNSDAIVSDVADSPDPALHVERDPNVREAYRSEVAKDTTHLSPDVKDVSGVRGAVLDFLSPSRNLEAMGQRDLHAGVVKAESQVNIHNRTDVEAISKIAEALKGNDTLGDQIVDYLQGSRKTINATDEATANMVKTFLDEKRTVLEGMGFKTLDDYFPHIFDKTSTEAKRLFKGKTNADISFGNVKARKGSGGDYSRDIVDVLMQYSRGFNRKVYLEPALKPLQDLRVQSEISQQTADWLGRYIEQLKGIREPATSEKLFNAVVDKALGGSSKVGNNHYRTTLGAQRMVSAVATMGLNPGTAIRNMTQVVNTVAGIGAKHATIGMKDATRALMAGPGSPEWKEMIASGVFDGGVSKNYQADLRAMTKGTSKAANVGQRGAEMFMGMIRGTDVTLRAHAYWGAKALAKSKGMSDAEARNFAINKVVDTQFVTSAADMPTKLNGPGIRSLTQLATFSGKQAEMLTQMGVKTFKKADGTFGINGEQARNMMSAAVVAGLTTAALKPLIGFNATEWVPFYSNIQPILDPNQTADAGIYRSPIVTLFAGDGKSKTGLIDAIKTGKMDEFLKDNWSSVVPAGTQIKKTTEGLQTTTSGESKNASGNVKFLQDQGGWNQLKAGLFGQYSTNAGQDWIKSGFPTLTDSQMRLGSKDGSGDVTFDQLPREKQQEFYDFYSKANTLVGHNKAQDAIKQAAKDGNANKAQRLGDQYNAKVAQTMAAYVKEHPDMPQELRDKLTNELFIDVQKQIDNGTGN